MTICLVYIISKDNYIQSNTLGNKYKIQRYTILYTNKEIKFEKIVIL